MTREKAEDLAQRTGSFQRPLEQYLINRTIVQQHGSPNRHMFQRPLEQYLILPFAAAADLGVFSVTSQRPLEAV